MYFKSFVLASLPLVAQAANIVISNDDGWAEINIRSFYDALTSAGESALVSAPAENESGTGSSMKTPTVLDEPCEFNSCPSGSPAVGYNSSDTRLNYVNSYPATSMEYGINNLSSTFFGGPPDLAVAGPNVGTNLNLAVIFSGTVGATVEAVNLGVPGIAFSGSSGSQTAWNATLPSYSPVYADLALNVTQTLLASGTPYLPSGVWLNVNFPASTSDSCSSASDFKFVLSRIYAAILTHDDVYTCGSDRLPTEATVVGTDGCYASISVGDASTKADTSEANQTTVYNKLKGILSCLP